MDDETRAAFDETRAAIDHTRAAFDETRTEFTALRRLILDFQRESAAAHAGTRAHVDAKFREIELAHIETRRYMGVLIDGVEDKIAALVEGFQFVNEKVDRNKTECDGSDAALDTRVTRLELGRSRRR